MEVHTHGRRVPTWGWIVIAFGVGLLLFLIIWVATVQSSTKESKIPQKQPTQAQQQQQTKKPQQPEAQQPNAGQPTPQQPTTTGKQPQTQPPASQPSGQGAGPSMKQPVVITSQDQIAKAIQTKPVDVYLQPEPDGSAAQG